MKNYFKILVATDYSEVAMNAERYAIKLAKDTNSVLTFMHVYQDSPTYPKDFALLEHADFSATDYEMMRLEQHVSELLQSMKVELGVDEYSCVINKGIAKNEILGEAGDIDPDFIIVGTHGESTLKKVFIGSHAWDVINKANVPVLAIPAEAIYSRVQSIVFATEYRKGEIPVIKFLAGMAAQFDAELTVLHVSNDVFSKDFEQAMFTRFMDEVKSKITYDKLNIRLVHDANLMDGLNGFCIRSKSNWLVMSPEKKLLFEKVFNPILSRTKQMSFYTHVPLFTVPDYYSPKSKVFWKSAEEKYDLSKDFFV